MEIHDCVSVWETENGGGTGDFNGKIGEGWGGCCSGSQPGVGHLPVGKCSSSITSNGNQ